jgi:hypothetical protein
VPEIFSVTGCGSSTGLPTNCPTTGGSVITVVGDGFQRPNAFINGDACFVLDTTVSIASFECELPPGAGSLQTLTVSSGTQFSDGFKAVSYAPPTITQLSCSSCGVANGLALTQCLRTAASSNAALTIVGFNFGPRAPVILVGDARCIVDDSTTSLPSYIQSQSLVTCALPSGNRLDRPVLLLQTGGDISASTATLSYTQCSRGTREVDLECIRCDNGTYAESESQTVCSDCLAGRWSRSGSYQCSDCLAGTFSESGSPNCTECPLGRFVSTGAQSTCAACDSGAYAPVTGLSVCASCSAGYYSVKQVTSSGDIGPISCVACSSGSYTAVSAQASCVQCDAGTYANATGASACTACDRGTYSTKNSTSGSGATGCTACSIGMTNSVASQQACTSCDSGSYSPIPGLSSCLSCARGRYSLKNTTSGAMNGGGATECIDCVPGTYADTNGTAICKSCSSGQFSAAAATSCTKCIAGTSQVSIGQSDCNPCDLGKYSSADGQAVCVEWYLSNSRSLLCCIYAFVYYWLCLQ